MCIRDRDLCRANESGSMSWRLTGAVEKGDSYRDKQFIDRKAIAPSAQFRLGEDLSLIHIFAGGRSVKKCEESKSCGKRVAAPGRPPF